MAMAGQSHPKNLILRSLPSSDFARLEPELGSVELPARKVLYRDGEPITTVYFPWGGVCSITRVMQDGRMVEVGAVGREGVMGYMAGFGDDIATGDCMVQVPDGGAYAMRASTFRAEMNVHGALHRIVSRFMNAMNVLAFQSVACNALHGAEERCARWLLMVHDRVGADSFLLSHEFLAVMLGVRRPTATIAAGVLQKAGLITYRRGRMTILNREGLEEAACECYAAVQEHFERLLPPVLAAD
jgi:CRP-like cAMP-binding protein